MSSSRRATKRSVDWKGVGRRIRELRGFDVNQEQFAKGIGISQTHLSKVELGKVEVGAEILLRIAREYNTTIEWLLTGEHR